MAEVADDEETRGTGRRGVRRVRSFWVTGLLALGCAGSRVPAGSQATAVPSVSGQGPVAVEQYLDDVERYAVPAMDRPCRGSQLPLVTVVEFVDFNTPFVRRVEPVVQRLLADYGEDIRICVGHFPIPRDNPYVTVAAECAEEAFAEQGSEGFFRAYDYLLGRPLDGQSVAGVAAVVPLRAEDLNVALRDHRHLKKIQADIDLASGTHYTGAPNFYIQGRHLGGARPYADFQALVDDELNRARGLVAAGLPRAEIYARVLEHPKPRLPEQRRGRPGEAKTVWIREILVSYRGYGLSPASRTRAEALAIAEAALQRVRRGEDFAEVARQMSEGSTAPRGGDHGALQRDTLTPETEDAAFALPVGGVSGVVESQHGFTIVQRYR